MVGIGYLTLSANFKSVGLILGLILIFVTCIASLFGTFMLGKVYYYYKTENYPDLVYKILGKGHYYLILVDLLFYILFSTTMYIYFSTELIYSVFDKYKWNIGISKIVMKLIISFFGFLLALFSLQKIRWTAYAGNFFSFFGAAVLVFQTKMFNEAKPRKIEFFIFSLKIFPAIGACFFAFTNQFSVVTIIKMLNNQKQKNQLSVICRSQYFSLLLYTVVAFSGYVSFGEDTPAFVLLREPLDDSKDILMTIAQLGLFLSLLVSLCVRITSAKDTLLALFNKKENSKEETLTIENKKQSKTLEIIINFILTSIAFTASIFLEKKIISIISLLSSILCPYFIIIAPSLMNLKMAEKLKISKSYKIFIIFFMVLFSLILGISIGINLYYFINDSDVIGNPFKLNDS
jgi:amino acid permease